MKKTIILILLLSLSIALIGCTQDTPNTPQFTVDDLEYTDHRNIPKEFEIPIKDLNQYFELSKDTWHPQPDDKCKITNETPQIITIREEGCGFLSAPGCGYYTWAHICEDKYFIIHSSASYGPHTYGPFNLKTN
ncbi:MAG: hypothetical protein HOE11_02895 [Candidatus Diapherotrites archaeon]|jgi:hypothetical protein|nr:hypothetical protein [Candidatus Diapherotrites archaeon]MBT4596885.1 hypothetical protein [Candidatus Diapherotrites archaeon]